MAFKLFLLWTFVLLGRPQDLMPALQPLRPALVLAALSSASSFLGEKGNRLSAVFQISETRKYGLFYLVMILGIPFAFHRRVAFEFIFLSYLVNMLFFLVFVSEVDSLKKLKAVLVVTSICTFIYGFFGITQGGTYGGRLQIYGGVFDSNDIAYVLISYFPLSLYFIFHREGTLKRIFATASIIASLMVILFSGSRGGMLGLLALIIYFLFAKSAHIKTLHKIIFIVLMSIVFISSSDNIDIERYLSLTDIGNDYNVTDEFGRVQIWKRAFKLLLSNPITGSGVECSAMAIGYARDALGVIPTWQVVHNSFLQVLVETGVLGFIPFTALIILCFKSFAGINRLQGTSAEIAEIKTISWLMQVAFVGQLVTAFFIAQGYSLNFTIYFAFSAVLKNISAGLVVEQEAN